MAVKAPKGLVMELMTGRHFSISIDETALSGVNARSNQPDNDKHWVAVIASPDRVLGVIESLYQKLVELDKTKGIDEFHAKDIWAGKKQFKNLSVAERLELVRFLVRLFTGHDLSIVVQTMGSMGTTSFKEDVFKLYPDLAKRPTFWLDKDGLFQLEKVDDLALSLLLQFLCDHIKTVRADTGQQACVVIDEGWKRADSSITSDIWADVFMESTIYFHRSDGFFLLQLADFAAWAYNRWQWLLSLEKLSYYNKLLLEQLSPLAGCFIKGYSHIEEGNMILEIEVNE